MIRWADGQITCLIRQPPQPGYTEATLPFDVWWERLKDRASIYFGGIGAVNALEAELQRLNRLQPSFPSTVVNYDVVQNKMDERELLEAQRTTVTTDLATLRQSYDELKQEISNLGNLRMYRGMNQPLFLMMVGWQMMWLTIKSSGELVFTPENETPPIPD